jgi:hypothetical protein
MSDLLVAATLAASFGTLLLLWYHAREDTSVHRIVLAIRDVAIEIRASNGIGGRSDSSEDSDSSSEDSDSSSEDSDSSSEDSERPQPRNMDELLFCSHHAREHAIAECIKKGELDPAEVGQRVETAVFCTIISALMNYSRSDDNDEAPALAEVTFREDSTAPPGEADTSTE